MESGLPYCQAAWGTRCVHERVALPVVAANLPPCPRTVLRRTSLPIFVKTFDKFDEHLNGVTNNYTLISLKTRNISTGKAGYWPFLEYVYIIYPHNA